MGRGKRSRVKASCTRDQARETAGKEEGSSFIQAAEADGGRSSLDLFDVFEYRSRAASQCSLVEESRINERPRPHCEITRNKFTSRVDKRSRDKM